MGRYRQDHKDRSDRRNERPPTTSQAGWGRNDERTRIAELAARLMVEDGIEDHAQAKRKAARQAGVADTRHLPDNDEIDAARARYQQLFHADTQRERLTALREKAVLAMTELAEFDPHLTGAVLDGMAGKYATIELHLFTDDTKAVELALLNREIDFQMGQASLYCGDTRVTVPVYTLSDDDVEIELTVLSRREARAPLKTSPAGRPIPRARLPAVEALLTLP